MIERNGLEPFEENEQKRTGGIATANGGGARPASSQFVQVDRHTADPGAEESSLVTILTLQRMKAEMMQQMENRIEGVIRKHQMQQQEGMPIVVSSTLCTKETFEEDGIEKVCWRKNHCSTLYSYV